MTERAITSTCTTEELERWSAYVADIAGRLRLGHIELRHDWDLATDENCAAMGMPKIERGYLTLRWSASLRSDSPEEQRDTAVHELVHWIVGRMDKLAEDVNGHIHRDAYDIWASGWNRELEAAVDHLTRVIAPAMPLPENVFDG